MLEENVTTINLSISHINKEVLKPCTVCIGGIKMANKTTNVKKNVYKANERSYETKN